MPKIVDNLLFLTMNTVTELYITTFRKETKIVGLSKNRNIPNQTRESWPMRNP